MEELSGIYQSYADEVKRFLICLTSNVDLAEELTQETFYQAIKSIHRYNGECKISVWLCQIAKHTYYNYLKKEKNNHNASVENMMQMGLDIPSNKDLPDVAVIKRSTLISIQLRLAKYSCIYIYFICINQKFLIEVMGGDRSFRTVAR